MNLSDEQKISKDGKYLRCKKMENICCVKRWFVENMLFGGKYPTGKIVRVCGVFRHDDTFTWMDRWVDDTLNCGAMI